METDTRQRNIRIAAVLLLALLLWLLLLPTAVPDLELSRRRAQLEAEIRLQEETLPPASPAPGPTAVLVIPPPEPAPAPPKEQPVVQDAYMESVHRYLRSLEVRHYDELARRKEQFDQKIQSESDRLARQKVELASFKAPPPSFQLSAKLERRLRYCIKCHEPGDPRDTVDFFARAGDFH